MKSVATALLLMFGLTQASADNKITLDDFSIAVGEEVEVAVNLTNTDEVISLQADVVLPTGLEYVAGSISVKSKDGEQRLARTFAPTFVEQASGAYRLLVTTSTNKVFAGNEGAVAYFTVKATEELAATSYITFDYVELSAAAPEGETELLPLEVTAEGAKVTLAHKLPGTNEFSAEETELTLATGETAVVNINLTNDAAISSFQAVLHMPAGLTIVEGVDGLFDYPERLGTGVIEYSPEDEGTSSEYRLAVYTPDNTAFLDNAGTILSFTVKAEEGLVDGSQITLSDIVVSDPTGSWGYELDDVIAITVNSISTGINAAAVNSAAEYYTVNGMRTAAPVKGINLVKTANGVQKVMVK